MNLKFWLTLKLHEQVKGTGTLKFLKRKSKLFHSTIEYVYLVLSTKKIMIGSFFQNVRLLSQERAQSQMVRRTNSILKLFFVGLNTNFPLCIVMRYGWKKKKLLGVLTDFGVKSPTRVKYIKLSGFIVWFVSRVILKY